MKTVIKPAVVLLSGGLDSTTTLATAKAEGFTPYAMSFRYGQRHAVELESAKQVAQAMGVAEHVIVDFDLRLIGGSALTSNLEVPKSRSVDEMGEGIPVSVSSGPDRICSIRAGYAQSGLGGVPGGGGGRKDSQGL